MPLNALLRERAISIHAPARGATVDSKSFDVEMFNFNPRSRTGSDIRVHLIRAAVVLFQSTLPHGERPERCPLRLPALYFNPRSRTGSDVTLRILRHLPHLFQSTLPHGERPT